MAALLPAQDRLQTVKPRTDRTWVLLDNLRQEFERLLLAPDEDVPRYTATFIEAFEQGGSMVRFPAIKMLEASAKLRKSEEARRLILAAAEQIRQTPFPEIQGPPPAPPPPAGDPQSPGKMKPGQRYLVLQTFTDFDRQAVEAGRALTFSSYSYFPYDGGYTLYFEEGVIRLAEIDDGNRVILRDFPLYFGEV
jgi:hypothetical protein